jgi:hypothetical protein
MKNTHRAYIGHLPINADLTLLKDSLKGTDYRLFRRGRGIRKGKTYLTKQDGLPRIRKDFRAHLPLAIADTQALYLRERGYSGQYCTGHNLITVCRNLVKSMGGVIN